MLYWQRNYQVIRVFWPEPEELKNLNQTRAEENKNAGGEKEQSGGKWKMQP